MKIVYCTRGGYLPKEPCGDQIFDGIESCGVYVKKGGCFPIVGDNNGVNVLIGKRVYLLHNYGENLYNAGIGDSPASPEFSYRENMTDISGYVFNDFEYFKYDLEDLYPNCDCSGRA